MRKIYFMIGLLITIICVASYSVLGIIMPKLEVQVSNADCGIGNTAELEVRLANVPAGGLSSCNFILQYDSNKLDIVSVKGGDLLKSPLDDLTFNTKESGKLYFLFQDESLSERNINMDGYFAKITVKAKASNSLSTTEVKIFDHPKVGTTFNNIKNEQINVIFTAGVVNITYSNEDINKDSYIDIFDLVPVAIRYGIALNEDHWTADCDINKDGIINLFDLLSIAKKIR